MPAGLADPRNKGRGPLSLRIYPMAHIDSELSLEDVASVGKSRVNGPWNGLNQAGKLEYSISKVKYKQLRRPPLFAKLDRL